MAEKELNKFEQVVLASQRARELSEGLGVLPENEGRKVSTVAAEELAKGLLKRPSEKDAK